MADTLEAGILAGWFLEDEILKAWILEAGILVGWFVESEILEDGIQKEGMLDDEALVADIL